MISFTRVSKQYGRHVLFVEASFQLNPGEKFTGRIAGTATVAGKPAILPTIKGRAWISGLASEMLDPSDPYPTGYVLANTLGVSRYDGAVMERGAATIAYGYEADIECVKPDAPSHTFAVMSLQRLDRLPESRQ